MRNPGNRRLPESFQSDIHFFNGSQSSALYKGLIVEPDMVTHSETTLIPCKEGTVVGAQKPFVWEPSPQCRRSVCYRCALDPTSKEVLHCSDCEWAYGGGKKCQILPSNPSTFHPDRPVIVTWHMLEIDNHRLPLMPSTDEPFCRDTYKRKIINMPDECFA